MVKKKKKKKNRSLVALSAIINRPSAGAFRNKKKDKKLRRQKDKNHCSKNNYGGFIFG